jgi:hypothetical protein
VHLAIVRPHDQNAAAAPTLSEQAFASSSIAGHPGRRVCQPSTHRTPVPRFDARCHAYACRQTPSSQFAWPAATARRSGDVHAIAPISVLVVWVLRVHLRLPPLKHWHMIARGSHERTSKRACAGRLRSLPSASTTRFPRLAQLLTYFLRLCSSVAYPV